VQEQAVTIAGVGDWQQYGPAVDAEGDVRNQPAVEDLVQDFAIAHLTFTEPTNASSLGDGK
jgi:hypothetical protein